MVDDVSSNSQTMSRSALSSESISIVYIFMFNRAFMGGVSFICVFILIDLREYVMTSV